MERELKGMQGIKLSWIGDWAGVLLYGTSAVWDGVLLGGLREQSEPVTPDAKRGRRELEDNLLDRIPAVGVVHIRNPLALAATLTALKQTVETAAPNLVKWSVGGERRGAQIVTVTSNEMPGFIRIPPLALHYTTAKDLLLVSLSRPALEWAIDATLDGSMPRPVAIDPKGSLPGARQTDPDRRQAGIQIDLGAEESFFVRAAQVYLEADASEAAGAVLRDVEALLRGLGKADGSGPVDTAALRPAALGLLGYDPTAAHGGTFRLGGSGTVIHSRYGSTDARRLPGPDAPPGALAKASRSRARARCGASA